MRARRALLCLALAALLPGAAPAQVIRASGHWAALERGGQCNAESRALRDARGDRPQARAGFAFDADGPRNGQFYARLGRTPRDGSSVIATIGDRPFMLVRRGDWAWSRGPAQEQAIIAAVRAAGGMRIEARDRSGRRIVDRYLLDGASTAIDAAAARCASADLAKARRRN